MGSNGDSVSGRSAAGTIASTDLTPTVVLVPLSPSTGRRPLAEETVNRETLEPDGVPLSYLHAGEGPPLLLLHGTYWSRVWLPVLPRLARERAAFALDFPGFGRSGGRLEPREASVSALADLVLRVADTLKIENLDVAGHDIGGGVAQRLATFGDGRVGKLALVNSVLYDSWSVPAVARFGDPEVARSATPEEFAETRRQSLRKSTARDLSPDEEEEYLSPWRDEDRVLSWAALAAAADPRYTLELVEPLRESGPPTLLIWGEEDEFQSIEYARRFEEEIPQARLVTIPGALHIPTEDDPELIEDELSRFFAG